MELKQSMSKEMWKTLDLFSLQQRLSTVYNSLTGAHREDEAATLLGGHSETTWHKL